MAKHNEAFGYKLATAHPCVNHQQKTGGTINSIDPHPLKKTHPATEAWFFFSLKTNRKANRLIAGRHVHYCFSFCVEKKRTATNKWNVLRRNRTIKAKWNLELCNLGPNGAGRHREFSSFRTKKKKKKGDAALGRRLLWKHQQIGRTCLLFIRWFLVFTEAACQPGLVQGGGRRSLSPTTPVCLNQASREGGSTVGTITGKMNSSHS